MEIPRTFALHFRKASCLCVCVWERERESLRTYVCVRRQFFSFSLNYSFALFSLLSILFAHSIRTNKTHRVRFAGAYTHTSLLYIVVIALTLTLTHYSEPICPRIAYSIFIVYLEVCNGEREKRSHVASAIPLFGFPSVSLYVCSVSRLFGFSRLIFPCHFCLSVSD